ncbi:glycosyltransferase family 2 protein [candidate division TA06 bacterium]|nr:glycosyltransferase family 2 protein [candidate division TA06 bacterium]
MKTAIIIPAYNAASTLNLLLARLLEFAPKHDIIIIDDGSSDGTAEAAKLSGVELIIHQHNRGKGAALRSGFELALNKGCEAVITIDADGQHDPKYIPALADTMDTGHWDIVVGSRRNEFGRMSFARYLSNSITTTVVSILAGTRITDSQSGYRIIRTSVLKNVKLKASRYQMESELLIKAARQGFKIGSVDITNIPGSTSHISHLKDTLRFVKMAMQALWI